MAKLNPQTTDYSLVRRLVAEEVQARQLNWTVLSEQTGLNRSTVRDFVQGTNQRILRRVPYLLVEWLNALPPREERGPQMMGAIDYDKLADAITDKIIARFRRMIYREVQLKEDS